MNTSKESNQWIQLPRRAEDNAIPIAMAGCRPADASVICYVCPKPFYKDTQQHNANAIEAVPELLLAVLASIRNIDTFHPEDHALRKKLEDLLVRITGEKVEPI